MTVSSALLFCLLNSEKFKIVGDFKAILQLSSVKEKLIDIISADMVDFFIDISRADKEQILQYFANHGRKAGAEYFLDRIEGMGTSWPIHLMQALQAQKQFDYMQYMYDEYQEHLKQSKQQAVTGQSTNAGKKRLIVMTFLTDKHSRRSF